MPKKLILETPHTKNEDLKIFPCTVYGKQLLAEIIYEYDADISHFFAIKYSDGIEIEAIFTESGEWWVDNENYRVYLLAIEEVLSQNMSA